MDADRCCSGWITFFGLGAGLCKARKVRTNTQKRFINDSMKHPEYIEGPKARDNFERGMIALFKVPKAAVVKAEKKRKKKRASARELKASDRD